MKTSPLLSAVITLLLASFASARAQNTAFTYQGRLNDNSQPANGNYDLRFAIHDAAADGNKVAGPVTNAAITVSNGLFTTTIDFGVNVFDGSARWLETAVRSAGTANAFISLAPGQAITPAPYALFTLNAATANNVSARAVAAPQLNTPGAPASGQVLGFNGTSLVWTNTSPADAVWALSGNSGTTPGVNFLGTTDNQPLELKANGQRILRLEPNVRGPNVIGGDASNYVASGVYGATIAGGGGDSDGNVVLADSAAIGGGNANSIQPNAFASVIGGGLGNTIQENAYLAII